MLKRNDLAKQFELVVQQEIKNFQDVSYQINQTLNDLHSKIQLLEKTQSSNNAILESQQKALSIQLEVFLKISENTQQRLESHINNNLCVFQSLMGMIEALNDGFSILNETCKDQKDRMDLLNDSIRNIEKHRNTDFLGFNTSIEQSEFKITQQMAALKKEILDLPSESDSLRSEMVEKINTHRIDVEGVLKEVRVTRKEVMILQKNIEAIYSLIDGLKKLEATS